MANSTATASLLQPPLGGVDRTEKIIRAYFKVVVTAGNYVTGGLPLDLTPVTKGLPVSKPPLFCVINSRQPAASANTSQWNYQFAPGTTMVNGTIQAFGQTASSGFTELTGGGATPAGLVADVIVGYADFQLG